MLWLDDQLENVVSLQSSSPLGTLCYLLCLDVAAALGKAAASVACPEPGVPFRVHGRGRSLLLVVFLWYLKWKDGFGEVLGGKEIVGFFFEMNQSIDATHKCNSEIEGK